MAGMRVPERIVLDGDDNGYTKLAQELRGENVSGTFPMEMNTPPRTLTVDEKTTVYSHNNSPARKVHEPVRNSFSLDEKALNDDGMWTRDLELMAEMERHSDSEDLNLVVDEVTDLRKSV